MKIFGRDIKRYLLACLQLPTITVAIIRTIIIFKHPFNVLKCYIEKKSPNNRVVELRNGKKIYLSDDPLDILTVFLIFSRKDYGNVKAGSTVLDIGANIGVFSLYAAFSGANKITAFEPSESSFHILQQNIKQNHLESVVSINRNAVVGIPKKHVKFPKESNVLNTILPDSSDAAEYDLVEAISFSKIINDLGNIDLLKIDCEGGEYEIFLNTVADDIKKVDEIRMEYHIGPYEEMVTRLKGLEYDINQFMSENNGGGCLWLSKKTPKST